MICAVCKKELNKTILHNVEVDFCPACLGLWFEEDEFRWAKDARDRDLRWLDIDLWKDEEKFIISPQHKLCPACRLPLYEVKYGDSEIKVDICNVCAGIWLDKGEFKKIIEYLKEKGEYEVLNNYAKNLAGEFWEIFAGPESLREEVLDFLTILKLFNYKLLVQYPTIAKIISQLPR